MKQDTSNAVNTASGKDIVNYNIYCNCNYSCHDFQRVNKYQTIKLAYFILFFKIMKPVCIYYYLKLQIFQINFIGKSWSLVILLITKMQNKNLHHRNKLILKIERHYKYT